VWVKQKQTGFTIVELLIVIVVIAILATISIVAYNGIRDRTQYSKALSDLTAINKAINVYKAQYDSYPVAAAWRYYCGYQSTPSNFIPGLFDVVNSIPAAPCSLGTNTDDTWIYKSDGTGYKLLYIRANVSSAFRNLVPVEMRDSATPNNRWAAGTTWGYWTSDMQSA